MPFTLICHACGQELKLFDSSIKKRKGTIRCTRCGAQIHYNLDERKIQKSGFWAEKTPAFDPRAKEKILNQLHRTQPTDVALPPNEISGTDPASNHNPFQSEAGFAKFDLKTGKIITPSPAKQEPKSVRPVPAFSHSAQKMALIRQKSMKIRLSHGIKDLPWIRNIFQKLKNLFHK